ncbi:hypothetical protein [Streptomyces avermitilis]|uniref:hypothetical protein n=1 Tax=Streptomyces avermitilis TaxID=33903 RepID=UPI0033BABABA
MAHADEGVELLDYAKDWVLPKPEAFKTERELSDHVLSRLDTWFHVDEQVAGLYQGRDPVRIDAVLRPRDPEPWYDREPAFGIEFKRPIRGMNIGSYLAWAGQAADYTHALFGAYGRVQVFLCPSPMVGYLFSEKDLDAKRRRRENLPARIAQGQIQIAEMVPTPRDTPERIKARERKTEQEQQARLNAQDALARAQGFADEVDMQQEQRRRIAVEMMRLMGQFNVGELMPTRKHGWTLLRSGEPLWSEDRGVRRRFSLQPRTAARDR